MPHTAKNSMIMEAIMIADQLGSGVFIVYKLWLSVMLIFLIIGVSDVD